MTSPQEITGDLEGQGLRIGIVVARFNQAITSRLLQGAQKALDEHGVRAQDVTIVRVPGSFELPVAAKRLAKRHTLDAIVCLGAVIRGETDHYEHVAGEAASGIASASATTGVPVILSVITCDTVEQAINRAGGKQGNLGYNGAVAAIEMANLMTALDAA